MYIDLSLGSGKNTTTSIEVAKLFNKKHQSVLTDINKLICSNKFREMNFAEKVNTIELSDNKYKNEIYFEISRDGFIYLMSGYKCKIASEIKEEFITIFSNYEKKLLGK